MQQKIKELRIEIDGLSQLVKNLKPLLANGDIPCHSYETREAYDKLILAKAWLGKILGELGSPTPYQKDGNRHTIEDIEKTADRTYTNYSEHLEKNWNTYNHIEKVDWLRQEIKKIVNTIPRYRDLDDSIKPFDKKMSLPVIYYSIIQHLSEARFWLGFELERIKNSEE